MDGNGRGVLKIMAPEVIDIPTSRKRCRHTITGLQLVSRAKVCSLDSFKRSYLGSIHNIWAKIPQDLIRVGSDIGWAKITKRCKNFLTGKVDKDSHKKRKVALLVDRTGADGYAIDGFKSNRDSEFETKINDYDWSLGIKV